MRIEQLYYFTEAVRAKSISAAAEKIFITQQTISQAINHLEKELGVQLLVRTPKGVELTHSGDIFYRKASQVLTDYGQLKTCFSEADGVDRAEDEALRLYSSKVINDAVLGDIVGNFYNIFPHMQLALTEKNSQDIIPLLVRVS